jgi:hypothetical protein
VYFPFVKAFDPLYIGVHTTVGEMRSTQWSRFDFPSSHGKRVAPTISRLDYHESLLSDLASKIYR